MVVSNALQPPCPQRFIVPFNSDLEIYPSLIAEWYSVWREVAQVKQGLALLVLGCLDSTYLALT